MFKKFIVIVVIIFVVGGAAVALQALGYLSQTLVSLFPIFVPVFEQAIKDYLSSAKFILAVSTFVLSTIGVIYTAKEKRFFYVAISAIINLISLISIISNLSRCSY